jgi:arginine exporter protein ArgO
VKKQPVLITNAARSQSEQLRSRQIRYVTMMGLRIACLITGAVLISVKPPLLALWLILCAAGTVFLPWAAVLIANDRPPKSRTNPAATPAADPRRVLTQDSAEEIKHRTIDVEP